MVWSQLAVPGDAPRLDDNNDGDGDGGIKEYRADDSFRLYVMLNDNHRLGGLEGVDTNGQKRSFHLSDYKYILSILLCSG